jgi:hypothetical protein
MASLSLINNASDQPGGHECWFATIFQEKDKPSFTKVINTNNIIVVTTPS